MSNLSKFNPQFSASQSEFMKHFFGESFLYPFDAWPFAVDEVRPLAIDISEQDGKLVVEASLPGVKPDDLDISVTDDVLTIKAESKQEKEEDKETYHYRERHFGAWQRRVLLPEQIDASKTKADFEDGVLKLSLPIVEGKKTKRIEVKHK